MHVAVVGSGYVGTTMAACLADRGHDVLAIDIDETIVEAINDGTSPIHEPGLDELVAATAGRSLHASTSYAGVRSADVIFLAVQTPPAEDGQIDVTYLRDATTSVAEVIAGTTRDHLVVVKSTVVPGTTETEVVPIIEEVTGESIGDRISVAVNPEFLREGSAVGDFLEPDKIVFGATDDRPFEVLRAIYDSIIEEADPAVVETGLREAELIKYANNAFLASKVSLINEIGNIAKEFDIDAYEVAEALAEDHRIDGHFLRSGVGWGGSCFGKDVHALMSVAHEAGYEPSLLEAAVAVNDRQPDRLVDLARERADLSGARVAVLGLAFKPGTDDVRNSRAIPVIVRLLESGAEVVAYDPVATDNMREYFDDAQVTYAESAEDALDGADVALVVTDWPEFAELNVAFDRMARPLVIDGRRIVDPETVDVEGFDYEGLTW